MRNLYWLTETQMVRLRPFFPKSRGRRRVATRYDRFLKVFLLAIALAATVIFWS